MARFFGPSLRCYFMVVTGAVVLIGTSKAGGGLIVDHRTIRMDMIPMEWLVKARTQYRLLFANALCDDNTWAGLNDPHSPAGSFDMMNVGHGDSFSAGKTGLSDRYVYENVYEQGLRIRQWLAEPVCDRNVLFWAWCPKASRDFITNVDAYLKIMDLFESDFPDVSLVYMTCPLEDVENAGSLDIANDRIREYCINKSATLFDLADIEGHADAGSASVSQAFWWLMASMAGWPGPIQPDLDRDGDVDLDDFRLFQSCMTGEDTGPMKILCLPADFDHDQDVDLSDFSIFQRCYSGKDTSVDAACTG